MLPEDFARLAQTMRLKSGEVRIYVHVKHGVIDSLRETVKY